jgi:hypothetical protein
MNLNSSDLRTIADAFAALVIMEALVKPLAIAVGRWLLARVDRITNVVPDWLYRHD